MTEWTPEYFEQLLADFAPRGDPNDPREIKRKNILRAATDHFVRFGYRKTNIQELAAEASVAKGTVYLYFKNKSELLVHAVAEEKQRYMGCLKAILDPSKTAGERLRQWIRDVFVLASQMPLTSRVLSGDKEMLAAVFQYMDQHKEQRLGELQLAFVSHLIRDLAGPDMSDQEVGDRARMLLTLAYFAGLIGDEKIRQGTSVERFADLLAQTMVDGIAGTHASGSAGDE